jgi:hypothetical protein
LDHGDDCAKDVVVVELDVDAKCMGAGIERTCQVDGMGIGTL